MSTFGLPPTRVSKLAPPRSSLFIKPLAKFIDPLLLYAVVRQRSHKSFLLESAPGPKRLSEFSFIGFDPIGTVVLHNGRLTFNNHELQTTSNPLESLRGLLRMYQAIGAPKYIGGLVGYVSYEFTRYLEDLPPPATPSPFPELELGLFLDGVIYDHRQGKAYYFSHGEDRFAFIERCASQARATSAGHFECGELQSDQTQAEFEHSVAIARELIAAGEFLQIVLSRQLSARYRGDLFTVYQKLRALNPSPYMYFLDFGPRKIAGSSPEMLVAVHDRTVTTYPIAGTRPLGGSPQETVALAQELAADPKERAEHVMLVDLAATTSGASASLAACACLTL